MTLPARTAVVVSTHRRYRTLHSCLVGFLRIVDRPEDLIFVDNGSLTFLGRSIRDSFPGITVLRLDQNGLFCSGYNAGIRVALEKHYDFVLIVNADTEVINDAFVRELLSSARQHPKTAFLGPLVHYRSLEAIQNTRLRFPSIPHQIAQWIFSRLFKGHVNPPSLCEEEVEFLNGVCVLCRCAALRDFGLMDEQYGGYVEDADWSWRARKSGWSSLFVPVPSIIHHEEREGYDHFSFKSYLLKRNTVLWFLKAGRKSSAFVYAFASIFLAWIRMLRARTEIARSRSRKFLGALSRAYRAMSGGESRLEIWQ